MSSEKLRSQADSFKASEIYFGDWKVIDRVQLIGYSSSQIGVNFILFCFSFVLTKLID